jgi:hypothetical protein
MTQPGKAPWSNPQLTWFRARYQQSNSWFVLCLSPPLSEDISCLSSTSPGRINCHTWQEEFSVLQEESLLSHWAMRTCSPLISSQILRNVTIRMVGTLLEKSLLSRSRTLSRLSWTSSIYPWLSHWRACNRQRLKLNGSLIPLFPFIPSFSKWRSGGQKCELGRFFWARTNWKEIWLASHTIWSISTLNISPGRWWAGAKSERTL